MERKPWNTWTLVSLAMAVVFACAGVWWMVSEGMNALSISMFILSLHSLLAMYLYMRWPQYADNISNMTQFVNHSRLALIWIGFLINDVFRTALDSSVIYRILVLIAIVAFTMMSIRALMAFLKEIRQ